MQIKREQRLVKNKIEEKYCSNIKWIFFRIFLDENFPLAQNCRPIAICIDVQKSQRGEEFIDSASLFFCLQTFAGELSLSGKLEECAEFYPGVSSHSGGQSTRCLIASLRHTMEATNSSWPGNQNKKLIWRQRNNNSSRALSISLFLSLALHDASLLPKKGTHPRTITVFGSFITR